MTQKLSSMQEVSSTECIYGEKMDSTACRLRMRMFDEEAYFKTPLVLHHIVLLFTVQQLSL